MVRVSAVAVTHIFFFRLGGTPRSFCRCHFVDVFSITLLASTIRFYYFNCFSYCVLTLKCTTDTTQAFYYINFYMFIILTWKFSEKKVLDIYCCSCYLIKEVELMTDFSRYTGPIICTISTSPLSLRSFSCDSSIRDKFISHVSKVFG